MWCSFVGGKLDGRLRLVKNGSVVYRSQGENYYRCRVVPNVFFRDPQKALGCNSLTQYPTSW
jgi:hypothetical protein